LPLSAAVMPRAPRPAAAVALLPLEPSSRIEPLNLVWVAMSPTWVSSAWYSSSRKARSLLVTEPDWAWTESAFMRWRMSAVRAMPPSATWSSEEAWPALTAACLSAVTSALILVPTASEAASSDAFTIREPLESFASELLACI
jgi:hypothetical protein